jgi:hypothetical protein
MLQAMPKYNFVVWNKRSRVHYPKTFYLPDVEAARQVATRIARVFGDVIPQWDDLTYEQQDNYAVEAVDQDGHTVVAVAFTGAEEPVCDYTRWN